MEIRKTAVTARSLAMIASAAAIWSGKYFCVRRVRARIFSSGSVTSAG